ncbi:MAG: Flp family type IVb pilin [Actinobacteria bacterium]|nr:Flp family type IVb pilin [Actinomycetota bacterium]MDP2233443.1 Flp family type IVb pilin [Actinomycetota bacterium]
MLTKLYIRMRTWLEDEEGATAVEYGLMVAGIAMLIILAVWALGGSLSTLFTNVANRIGTAAAG